MSYPNVITKVFNSLWAIDRNYLETIFGVLHSRVTGETVAGVGIDKVDSDGRRDDEEKREGSTAVIFASGIVAKHLSEMDETSTGGMNLDRLQRALAQVEADPEIRNVVLHLDTPGGVIHGVPETAEQVRRLSEKKTVVGFVDSMAASAGYWMMAGVEYLYVTPSSDVGSIGVYSALLDYTGWMEKKGLKMELFKAGRLKAAGMPGVPLSDEQREDIQSSVDDAYAMFSSDIRRMRGEEIDEEVMQGQVFRGKHAVKAGLADEVVNGIGEVLEDLRRIG